MITRTKLVNISTLDPLFEHLKYYRREFRLAALSSFFTPQAVLCRKYVIAELHGSAYLNSCQ